MIVKAHAAVLANQSKELHQKFYPIPAGQTLPMIVSDWTQAAKSEEALKAFCQEYNGQVFELIHNSAITPIPPVEEFHDVSQF